MKINPVKNTVPVLQQLAAPADPASGTDETFAIFNEHSTGKRIKTSVLITAALRERYPDCHLTLTIEANCPLIAFANAGFASYVQRGQEDDSLFMRQFQPPVRRYGDNSGSFASTIVFAAFDYKFQGHEFLIYVVNGRDGGEPYPQEVINFILSKKVTGEVGDVAARADALIEKATTWALELHNEVLVFDQGFWQKNSELWKSIQKAFWEDVILDEEKKQRVISDVEGFFDSEKDYDSFGVPWKRGLIFYGPPGNGKTISIKALMHSLGSRKNPTVEVLYVKTLTNMGGPERAIRVIFQKARAMAPCLLVFEDLDSLISPQARSYFLNEIDGLESNHGILMIGSTNHLEQLDPGIAKRPSRFDRKYFYDDPTRDERVQYAEYWRKKLEGNEKIDFPKSLKEKIADITDGFSFAYMKEAFVAALMSIVVKKDDVSGSSDGEHDKDDDLEKNLFWQEFKKQIKNLRDEMDSEKE